MSTSASRMREAIWNQPVLLAELLRDRAPAAEAAERLRDRRVYLVGTGTSWHAAAIGATWLRAAGLDATAVQAADAATDGPVAAAGDALVLLSHRGTKRYTGQALAAARAAGASVVLISSRQNADADLVTSDPEQSAAFTISHLAALARLAQLAEHLGADLGPLDQVPEAVSEMLDGDWQPVPPPARLLQFTGAGINQWTAAEAALKVRETAYVAAEGLNAEQLLHGPSVALGGDDRLVAFDGGGPQSARLDELATLVRAYGTPVHVIRRDGLGEPLSVFPLTTAAQLIALEAAEGLGTNPDSFGRDLPGRADALAGVEL
jgi:glucosamine--fructose-6-phosphate aminotransferase (isomerizing)